MATTRWPRFQLEEVEVLVENVEKHKNIIFSKFSDTVTNERKAAAWKSVTDAVNSASVVGRDIIEVRNKWRDWSSVIKNKKSKRQQELRKTGGGVVSKEVILTITEEKVLQLIGDVAVRGIRGGIASSCPDLQVN